MICDIRSYIPAMHYMLAFNEREHIITYWDEPTITMDYETHEFHSIIKRNWDENLIPNMVLSSATLPKLHELTDTIADFMENSLMQSFTTLSVLIVENRFPLSIDLDMSKCLTTCVRHMQKFKK